MPAALVLSFDTLTATIPGNKITRLERSYPNSGDTDYSMDGTPLDDGPFYEPKLLWSVTAFVTRAQFRSLKGMFFRSNQRRSNSQAYALRLIDTCEEFVEDSPRTRAIAPSTSATTSGDGTVAYYAQFNVRMFEPAFPPSGNPHYPYLATFTLKELDKAV